MRLVTCESAIRLNDRERFKGSDKFVDIVAKAIEIKVLEDGGAKNAAKELMREGCPNVDSIYLLRHVREQGSGKVICHDGV